MGQLLCTHTCIQMYMYMYMYFAYIMYMYMYLHGSILITSLLEYSSRHTAQFSTSCEPCEPCGRATEHNHTHSLSHDQHSSTQDWRNPPPCIYYTQELTNTHKYNVYTCTCTCVHLHVCTLDALYDLTFSLLMAFLAEFWALA